ncbi:MAG: ABC transporter substrate-binding protein [Eubacterium sp.]|nr:ABC transporter substrate-binding protein [Eubacterium sp.]
MKGLKKLVSLLLVTVMVFSLAACGGSTDSGDEQGESGTATETADGNDTSAVTGEAIYGGTLNMTMQTLDLDTDPSCSQSYKWELWFERLFQIDVTLGAEEYQDETTSSSRLTGMLADTWEWDSEAQTFTVTLKDACFQDKSAAGMEEYDIFGARAVTAEDVVYSYDRLLGIGMCDEAVICDENWESSLYMIESIEAADDKTVVFHFNTSADIAASDFMLCNVNITGPEWDDLTDDQKADWHYACGTGAYVLTDFEIDSYATFTKSTNYYGVDTREGYEGNELPYIETITMSMITENANQITQFVAGNQDIIGWNRAYLTDSETSVIKDSLTEDDYTEYIYLGQPSAICYKISGNEPLQDIRVRQAMQMAINMDEINDSYYGYDTEAQIGGLFSVTTDYSSVDSWDDELLSTYEYDPEGAKALLEEAGYGDGFTFYVAIHSGLDSDLYTLIKDYLGAVGINMEITVASDPNEMNNLGTNEEDPNSIEGSWGMSSTFFVTIMWKVGGPGYTSFNNDSTVEGFFTQLDNVTSEEEEIEVAQDFDKYMAEQHYALVISPYTHIPVYVSTKIGGLDSSFIYSNMNVGTLLNHCWDTTAAE